jgi:hypothetical protein
MSFPPPPTDKIGNISSTFHYFLTKLTDILDWTQLQTAVKDEGMNIKPYS